MILVSHLQIINLIVKDREFILDGDNEHCGVW